MLVYRLQPIGTNILCFHNPVKHRYTEKRSQWPWSSATEWLQQNSREAAEEQWKKYPIGEYGSGWDDAEL